MFEIIVIQIFGPAVKVVLSNIRARRPSIQSDE